MPLGLDILGLGHGAAYGWSPLVGIGALCLFGLAHPQAQVLLFRDTRQRARVRLGLLD